MLFSSIWNRRPTLFWWVIHWWVQLMRPVLCMLRLNGRLHFQASVIHVTIIEHWEIDCFYEILSARNREQESFLYKIWNNVWVHQYVLQFKGEFISNPDAWISIIWDSFNDLHLSTDLTSSIVNVFGSREEYTFSFISIWCKFEIYKRAVEGKGIGRKLLTSSSA